jgi:hypothetical protein
LCVTQHVSFTHHTASSILTTKTLLGLPHDISCLGLCTKLTWWLWFLSSELFYLHCQESLQSEFIHRSGNLLSLPEPWGCCNHAAECISLGKGQDPPSWTEYKIPDRDPKLLELITFSCRKQTHKRQKILARQFSLDQEGASMCSLQLSKHTSRKWLTVASPYIPDTFIPGICPSQRFTLFPDWLKGLGDELGHAVCQAMELNRNPEKEVRTP